MKDRECINYHGMLKPFQNYSILFLTTAVLKKVLVPHRRLKFNRPSSRPDKMRLMHRMYIFLLWNLVQIFLKALVQFFTIFIIVSDTSQMNVQIDQCEQSTSSGRKGGPCVIELAILNSRRYVTEPESSDDDSPSI